MKDYKDPIINAVAEILSEGFAPGSYHPADDRHSYARRPTAKIIAQAMSEHIKPVVASLLKTTVDKLRKTDEYTLGDIVDDTLKLVIKKKVETPQLKGDPFSLRLMKDHKTGTTVVVVAGPSERDLEFFVAKK